jgi:hypothetical protein
MKSFKSDGRYKYHDKGLGYIVQFMWSNLEDRNMFVKMIAALKELYGPEKDKYTSEAGYTFWKMNEHWRCEQNRSAKRRRIYLKDESALTYILLQVSV